MPQHLLGVAEIAAMLGLSRQRINQLVQSDDFPAPEAELSAGRIWSRSAVEAWVAAHPGRATDADSGSFGAFTDATRAVVVRAQEEARGLRHAHLGTEHLLLAVASDAAPAVAARLGALGVGHDDLLSAVATRVPPGDTAPVGHIPFTPRSKEILTRASAQAGGAVEPRHLAQAIVRVADGVAAELLRGASGMDQDALVAAVDRLLGDDHAPALFSGASELDVLLRCSFCTKDASQVQKLVAGPGIYICDECIDLCNQIIADERGPDGHELRDRLDRLVAEVEQLRRDLDDQ